MGALQDDIMFSTTPSFGTESLGKPRPGRGGAVGKSSSRPGLGSSLKRADGSQPVAKPQSALSLPKLPGVSKADSHSQSPVPARSPAKPSAEPIPVPASSVAAVVKAETAPTAAPERESKGTNDVKVDAHVEPAVSSSKPAEMQSSVQAKSTPSLQAAKTPARTAPMPAKSTPVRTIPPVAAPQPAASAPAPVEARVAPASSSSASAAKPKSKPRPKSGGAHRNPRGPTVESLADVEDLRKRQNEQLLWIIEHEQSREKARTTVLASERNPKRRAQLEGTFALERKQAQEKIEGMKADNEAVLVAHMTRLGFAR